MAEQQAQFPLQLIQVVFTKCHVEAIQTHDPNANPGQTRNAAQNVIKIEKVEGKTHEYVFIMHTKFNPERDAFDPYFVDIECFAVFSVVPDLSEEETHKALTITGHSVVYGAIRESISWITARQPFGPLALGLSILIPKPKEASSDITESK
jgi:preprotein translocase subunit SecB